MQLLLKAALFVTVDRKPRTKGTQLNEFFDGMHQRDWETVLSMWGWLAGIVEAYYLQQHGINMIGTAVAETNEGQTFI